MKILSLEFSGATRSAAVLDDTTRPPSVLGSSRAGPNEPAPPFQLIESALDSSGLQRADIGSIAIGLGPGSYTGIRMALAIAQGWQLARNIQTVGVPTPCVLAHQLILQGHRGPAHIVIDAQRREFYLAEFELAPERARPLGPIRLAAQQEVEKALREGRTVAGPNLQPRFPNALSLDPDAVVLGHLACVAGEEHRAVPAELLEPIYLRPVDYVKAPPPHPVAAASLKSERE